VVEPRLLSKLLLRRQRQEVDGAGLEELVDCPFCEYATVMESEADRVLVCRSLDCGRESCRLGG
jgi:TRIAD3 protein (E3 ubiquitin-protein ligase RNF216)